FYRGGNDPKLTYTIQFTEAFLLIDKAQAKSGSIAIDGQTSRIGATPVSYTWTGAPHEVLVRVNDGSVYSKKGMWAIFRFFASANVVPQGANFLVTNPLSFGRDPFADAKFVVNLGGAPAVFDKRFFASLKCTPNVALR